MGALLLATEVVFLVLAGFYIWNVMKSQSGGRTFGPFSVRDSRRDLDEWARKRETSLTEPLNERVRPQRFEDIVGQSEGIKALRAALCGPHPQHVILYGPPGVGKTAAARLVLEEAKENPKSPFGPEAPFIEVDATTVRFDERGIADPLIGSVHDPIYQGAGAMGAAGIPQPKPGAVTRAHGGILFIDEIGELHPIQMNKLLKVLEDRRVLLESAYYRPGDSAIPPHIHDLFQNGLPADFRLIGATTRPAHELPPALRSRCVEIYFRPLYPDELAQIAERAARRIGVEIPPEAVQAVAGYAGNGRDAVNLIQIAAGAVQNEGRDRVEPEDVEWVVQVAGYSPQPHHRVAGRPTVGLVHGLAVYGPNVGRVLPIEASALYRPGAGQIRVTGVIDEEEVSHGARRMKRRSTAQGSVENAETVLRRFGIALDDWSVHINIPGGVPADGPSAGLAIAMAMYSAIREIPVDGFLAVTGEISLSGSVKAVDGVPAKIEAARKAGARRVLIPDDNWSERWSCDPELEIIPVRDFGEALVYLKGTLLPTVPDLPAPAVAAAGSGLEADASL